jgi:diacylglycerol kinase
MAKIKSIKQSFKEAFNGFRETLIKETSFKIMLVIAAVVLFFLFYFPTSREEKAVIFAVILGVLVLELINSTVEKIMDFIDPDYNNKIRIIKDLMAAIVLLASIGAVIVGILIFYPYIIS